jgi:undecaprenyl-diphosphatase
MTLYDAAILGIVEGLTEFLPVSSTAHLVLTADLLKLQQDSFMKAFEIIIQIAPIFAVMFIYRDTFIQKRDLWFKLIAAFIPTGAIGFFFHEQIDQLFFSGSAIFWMVVTGFFFLIIEFIYNKRDHHLHELDDITYKQAITIGFFQSFALIPGISRSGTTILGAMLLGFERNVAMSFSFLLAIPTMGAASGYMLLKEYSAFDFSHWELLVVGFVVSFVVGWVAVKTFLAIVSRYNFTPFAIYLFVSAFLFWVFTSTSAS